MEISEAEYLAHYGTPRHSGRYPWGSGGNEEGTYTRNPSFLDEVERLQKSGLTEKQIAEGLGLRSTTELRAKKSIEKNAQKQAQIDTAQKLKNKGLSNVAIGQQMGLNESSVRSLLAPGAKDKADVLLTTAKMLKKEVDEKGFIDVGTGVEKHLGISSTKLSNSVAVLKEQGYPLHNLDVEQVGTGKLTNMKVLCPPGTTYGDVIKNKDKITLPGPYSIDGGRDYIDIQPPRSISSKRVGVIYKEQGGSEADGVIYVRQGVPDISLGASSYAQVRVKVDDSHYLKGMAMYKDDMPDGVDLLFNTNKSDTGNKKDAFKEISSDPENPFGAITRQITDPKDKTKVTSVMNLVNEEGDWTNWSNKLASQVLSKQSPALARTQLNMTYEKRVSEYKEIQSLTNPTVKKKLLKSFADETDSAAVHLKAAQLPKQGWHVILPMKTLPETEIYAPNYQDGTTVVLIRYPHGGTFEIPRLKVNNNHPPAKRSLGNARDAVAIHPKVAERLSGADFDGDTVLVIPDNQRRIKDTAALDQLKGFDPREQYKSYDGMPRMTAKQKGFEMGSVSNLITDMTIQGAPHSEIARAVKHSMVVIDAEKHHLNYKQSAIDNNISQLKEKYQGGPRKGASTIISRAQRTVWIPDRKERPASLGGPIDRETGKRVFVPTGRTTFKTGGTKLIRSQELAEVDDARLLVSNARTPMENLYADHSNKLKTLANQARLSYLKTPALQQSKSAKKVYESEVRTLDAKLSLAIYNRPLERQAQLLANSMIRTKRLATPGMDEPTLKKIKGQSLETARRRTGAGKNLIEITPKEWEAIQAGAISDSKLSQILDNANLEIVKQLATPKTQVLMTSSKTARAQAMLASGYTRAEVAAQLGVSLSTLDAATTGS